MSVPLKNRLQSIDLLRLILLLEIIFGHAVALVGPNFHMAMEQRDTGYAAWRTFFGFGRESAYLFIFVSGYFSGELLFLNLTMAETGRRVLHRIWRLVPIATLAIFITVALDYTGAEVLRLSIYENNGLNYNVEDHTSPLIFILNLLQLQPTFVQTIGSNGPIWTVGYLLQFYFLSALISITFPRSVIRVVGVIFIVSSLAFLNVEFSLLFICWAAGRSVNQLCMTKTFRSRFAPYLRRFVARLTLILLGLFLLGLGRLLQQQASILLTSLSGFAIIGALVSAPAIDTGDGKLSETIDYLSEASFGAYLLHMPILFIILGLATRNASYILHTPSVLLLTISTAATILLTVLGGSKLQRFSDIAIRGARNEQN